MLSIPLEYIVYFTPPIWGEDMTESLIVGILMLTKSLL